MDTNSNQNQQKNQKPGLSWTQPAQTNQPKAPQQPQKTPATPPSGSSKKRIIIATAVILIALGLWAVSAMRHSGSESDSQKKTATTTPRSAIKDTKSPTAVPTTSATQNLTVPSPQDSGTEVAVTYDTVTAPTWIVVYENRDGQPGNALGAAFFAPELQNKNTVSLLRGTLPEQTYFVGESRDDGDRIFSLKNDQAVHDQDGKPVLVQFQTK